MGAATIFLLDEFVLPDDDPARCDNMLERDLLDRLATPPADVVTWTTAGNLTDECEQMEADISDGGLRLAIVGLGMNGHVGTNEPGSSIETRSRVVSLASTTSEGAMQYGARNRPTQALTMGIATLLEADEVWLIVTGEHKQPILRAAVHGPTTPAVPASLLRNHKQLVVLADEDAAAFSL